MKICSKCKIEKPKTEFSKDATKKDGLRSGCRSCKAKYRNPNTEKAKARDAARYAANPEKIRAKVAEYRKANPGKSKAKVAEYYAANREIIAAHNATYRKANPEKRAAQHAAYYAANPEKFAAHNRNRRSRARNAEGKHTAADIRAIFASQRGLCANCLCKLFKSGKQKYHVDHIMPLARGGNNWPSNLQCLCPACNLSKSSKHPAEWAKQQGKLL